MSHWKAGEMPGHGAAWIGRGEPPLPAGQEKVSGLMGGRQPAAIGDLRSAEIAPPGHVPIGNESPLRSGSRNDRPTAIGCDRADIVAQAQLRLGRCLDDDRRFAAAMEADQRGRIILRATILATEHHRIARRDREMADGKLVQLGCKAMFFYEVPGRNVHIDKARLHLGEIQLVRVAVRMGLYPAIGDHHSASVPQQRDVVGLMPCAGNSPICRSLRSRRARRSSLGRAHSHFRVALAIGGEDAMAEEVPPGRGGEPDGLARSERVATPNRPGRRAKAAHSPPPGLSAMSWPRPGSSITCTSPSRVKIAAEKFPLSSLRAAAKYSGLSAAAAAAGDRTRMAAPEARLPRNLGGRVASLVSIHGVEAESKSSPAARSYRQRSGPRFSTRRAMLRSWRARLRPRQLQSSTGR